LTERYPVFAMYLKDNWRAFRTWDVSAISPWEFEHFWKLRDGVDRSRKEFTVNWQDLQRPGFSPDYEDQRYERMDLAYDRSDWVPTVAAQMLLENNGPLLAYLAGKPAAFTSKDHLFQPGESIEKQLVIINNSRIAVTADYQWSLERPGFAKITGTDTRRVSIPAGQQQRVPLKFDVPSLAPDAFSITAEVRFSSGETQHDSFPIEILPKPAPAVQSSRIAVFDPKADTAQLLERLGWRTDRVGPGCESYQLRYSNRRQSRIDPRQPRSRYRAR
jgi:hypothetical protein